MNNPIPAPSKEALIGSLPDDDAPAYGDDDAPFFAPDGAKAPTNTPGTAAL